MTTINNLIDKVGGIEKARGIVSGAPNGATHTIESFNSLDYLKFDGDWWIHTEYQNAPSEWVLTCFRTILAEFKESIQRLDDLRTAIAQHDEGQNVMDKPKTYNEWHSSLKDFEGLRHANCCKISYEAGQQSRQAEVDEQHKINVALNSENIKQREQITHYMNQCVEKRRRIRELQAKNNAVEHKLGCAMIAPKEVFQFAERIGKALRGEDE